MTQSPPGRLDPSNRRGGLLRVLMGTVLFVALLIFGTGMASLLTETDVIAVPGFGQLPGVFGVIAATIAFVSGVTPPVLRGRPRFALAIWIAALCYLCYLGAIFIAATFAGVDLGVAASVVARLAVFWYGPIVALAAAIAAIGVFAITQAREHGVGGGRWPWERPEDE